MTVTVLALRDFYYCGQDIIAGQPVAMIPIDAAVEARAGNVSLDKQLPTYHRRDLRAEEAPMMAAVLEALPPDPPKVVKRRRSRKKVIA
jgi:hypothetical protein